MVGDKDPWIRSSAFAALARTDREEAALILSGIDPDPVWWVRASLATALGAAGDEISVGILFAMLKDEDVRVLPPSSRRSAWPGAPTRWTPSSATSSTRTSRCGRPPRKGSLPRRRRASPAPSPRPTSAGW